MASAPIPVYSKSNPAGGTQLPARQKRLLIIACAVIAVLAVGGAVWGGLSSDSRQASANGCINVNLSGSIGGQLLHACGDQAKSVCRAAYAASDATSLAERPACEQAGLTKARLG